MRLIFKTSSVTSDFFYVFNLILSFSTCSQSFKKICVWELLGANVLKPWSNGPASSRKWTQVELAKGLVLGGQTDSQVSSQVHASRKKDLYKLTILYFIG